MTMTKLQVCCLSLFISIACPITSAVAYDGLVVDYKTCTTGGGKVSNAKVVNACSRLIDNAKVKNETVGYFYALRAIANTDRALNCSDARTAAQLLNNPKLKEHTQTLIKTNC